MNSRRPESPGLIIGGMVKVGVIDSRGNLVKEGDWQRNLILDCGLDRLAIVSFCDLFKAAVKGTGTGTGTSTATSAAMQGTYSLTYSAGVYTLTRTSSNSGDYSFTEMDIGKLVRNPGSNVEVMIKGYTSSTAVTVGAVGGQTLSTASTVYSGSTGLVMYFVNQFLMDAEVDRSTNYSKNSGDNKTTTVGGVRTFQRAYIFGPENSTECDLSGVFTWNADKTLTCTTNVFLSSDNGGFVFLNGIKYAITAYTSATSITLSTAGSGQTFTTPTDTVTVYPPIVYSEIGFSDLETAPTGREVTLATSGTLSSGSTLQASAAGGFDSGDLNCYVSFTDGTNTATARITYVAGDGSSVTINRLIPTTGSWPATPALTSATVYVAPPVNIRIPLSTPVSVQGPNLTDPSQQLVVFYQFVLTASPTTATSVVNPIANWSVSGKYAIEEFLTSTVNTDGTTNNPATGLDPCLPTFVAMSASTAALAPLSAVQRSTSATVISGVPGVYGLGSFTQTYTGTFGIADAVGTQGCLMLYDPATGCGIVTFRFQNNSTGAATPKAKASGYSMNPAFQKTWGRSLP